MVTNAPFHNSKCTKNNLKCRSINRYCLSKESMYCLFLYVVKRCAKSGSNTHKKENKNVKRVNNFLFRNPLIALTKIFRWAETELRPIEEPVFFKRSLKLKSDLVFHVLSIRDCPLSRSKLYRRNCTFEEMFTA